METEELIEEVCRELQSDGEDVDYVLVSDSIKTAFKLIMEATAKGEPIDLRPFCLFRPYLRNTKERTYIRIYLETGRVWNEKCREALKWTNTHMKQRKKTP